MVKLKTEDIYKELLSIGERDGEEAARKFLAEHLSEFPEDIQGKVTLAFFEEALQNSLGEKKQVVKVVEEALNTIEKIQKDKNALQDKLKILKIKESLK